MSRFLALTSPSEDSNPRYDHTAFFAIIFSLFLFPFVNDSILFVPPPLALKAEGKSVAERAAGGGAGRVRSHLSCPRAHREAQRSRQPQPTTGRAP